MKRSLLSWTAFTAAVLLLSALVIVLRPQKAAVMRTEAVYEPVGESLWINQATREDWESLPGIGEVLAGRILEFRAAHGDFASVDELILVDGIGEKTLQNIQAYLTAEKGKNTHEDH